jgi:hypothetical protein
MRSPWRLVFLLLAFGFLGCGGGDDDGGGNVGPSLQAGVAEVRMPVPVGIGTVGYFGVTVAAEPSPFARRYPATTRLHGHPSFRAVAISQGPGKEVVFLRSDMIGVFQQFRRAVVLAAEARLGRSLDDAIVFGGTHTHAGPGRLLDGGGLYDVIADSFFPEFYERMVDAAATAIVEALEDLAPARIGYTWVLSPTGHSDRRCEDGRDYTNDALPIVAVERGGSLDALVFAYAVHSTALGIEDLTLSRDVAGAIEEYVEEGFDHPVLSVFFNSWGADMSPGSPDITLQPGAAQPNGYERMNKVGRAVADAIHEGLSSITWEENPEVFASIHRVYLNRSAIGYADSEFPYNFGGVFCGLTDPTDCDPLTMTVGLDHRCIPFPSTYPVPPQTELSAGRVGSLAFVTFPGEPGTLLAEELLGRLEDRFDQSNVMLLGYTQDYTGYSILEDDWVQGGYEASGALWGPRQGEYLVDSAEAVFERVVVDRAGVDPLAPAPLPPFDVEEYGIYAPALGEEAGTIASDVSPSYALTEIVSLTVKGSDPWLGAPTATLTDDQGMPIRTAAGRSIDSNGYGFWVDLVPQPGYRASPSATSRTFLWTFSMPAAQTVPGLLPELSGGTYRLRVSIPTAGESVAVSSSAFTIGN